MNLTYICFQEGEESEAGSQPYWRIGEIAGEVTKAGARLNARVQVRIKDIRGES